MDYAGVLKRAWQITWRNKALWILGILASCSGNGGSGNRSASGMNFRFPSGSNQPPQGMDQFFQGIPEGTLVAIVLAILCAIVLIAVIFWVLGALGQSGLIAGFNVADEAGAVSLGQAFNLGLTFFWKLLIIQIIVGVVWFVVIALVLGVGLGATVLTAGLALICLIPMLCILVPVAVVAGIGVNVYALLTQVAIVVDDLSFGDAFRKAWQVAREHLGPVIIMALILIIGALLVGVVIALPVLVVVAPLVTGFLLNTQASITGGIATAGACLVLYIPFALILNGILQTFVTGSWTLTYRRLTGRAEGAEVAAG